MNKNSRIATTIATLATALIASSVGASTFYNGWNYAIDSLNDGSGGAVYEFKGLAYAAVENDFVFAISTGMPLGGQPLAGALGGTVSVGDLFINFSGHNLDSKASFQEAKVIGIRFDASNDSGVQVGAYNNLGVKSYTTQNNGWATLQAYLDGGFGRNSGAMGDLGSSTADVAPYLGLGEQFPNIHEGTHIGNIATKDRSQLATLGLDFGHFGADPSGNNVYGFSLSRDLLPQGDFTAHLYAECMNDGVAIKGSNAVPEPATIAALGLGLAALGRKSRRNRR